jgi:hypothetical protein
MIERCRAKLAPESIHGDFAGASLTADSREYIVTCRRPAIRRRRHSSPY